MFCPSRAVLSQLRRRRRGDKDCIHTRLAPNRTSAGDCGRDEAEGEGRVSCTRETPAERLRERYTFWRNPLLGGVAGTETP